MLSSPLTVLGIGNSCEDTFFKIERYPNPGQTARIRERLTLPGGQVAGTLTGCARLGLRCGYMLRTGDDSSGDRQRRALAAEGIDLSHSRILQGVPSASAYILRDTVGRRTVIWNTDSRLAVLSEEIDPDLLRGVRILFFDGKDGPACLKAARLARGLGVCVVADLDHVYPHTTELLGWIDHLIAPEEFVLAFGPSLTPALKTLAASGPQVVVATRGSQGAVSWDELDQCEISSAAFSVAVTDSTGAGDAFHAGYIYALVQNWPRGWTMETRLRFANAAGALACAHVGSLNAMPSIQEVNAMVATGSNTGHDV